MSTTPWEKDERNWRNTPQLSDMKISPTPKPTNTGELNKPDSLIIDEIGQMAQIYKLPTRDLQYEVKKYPDGSQYVVVLGGNELTFKLNDYSDLWTLNQINDALVKEKRTCSLCITNILDGQADRRFNPHESSGLLLICQFLNNLQAFTEISVFHPHNPEVVEALLPYKVRILDNSYFIRQVLLRIARLENPAKYTDNTYVTQDMAQIRLSSSLVLMSSDAGGFKPMMKLADKIAWKGETYSASKSRPPHVEGQESKLIQEIGRQDFGGKDILIIDDICVYGGTFKGLAKLLRERNCGKLYLAVSHMTIQNLGTDAVTNYFDKIYTTNSKFDRYWDNTDRYLSVKNNLEVIDLF